ncbi:MAG: transposase [marine benthic group bacterium]|nr:transposase [Gemmatimonadota bacterium]
MSTRERTIDRARHTSPAPAVRMGFETGGNPAERAAHRLYAEIVWSTVDRLPLVALEIRGSIEAHLITLCRRLDIEPVAVRVTASRARLLIRFKPSHSLGAVVASLKLGSQDAAVVAGRPVRWARGFATLSLSVTEVRRRARRLKANP